MLVGWLVRWSFTSLFSTNTAISETKGQGWRVILLWEDNYRTVRLNKTKYNKTLILTLTKKYK